MIPENIVEEITARITKSVDRVIVNRRERRIETEPSFTDRLLANIERDFEDQSFPIKNEGIKLHARTLGDRGPNASESIYGADLTTVLNVDLNGYKINKGILAQSKSITNATIEARSEISSPYFNETFFLANPYSLSNPAIAYSKCGTIEFNFSNSEFNRLKSQCESMLEITPDSFVYLYCPDDIYVIPASSVISQLRTSTSAKYYCKNLKAFMNEYLKSFIGDPNLHGTTNSHFDKLLEKTKSNKLLYLQLSNK